MKLSSKYVMFFSDQKNNSEFVPHVKYSIYCEDEKNYYVKQKGKLIYILKDFKDKEYSTGNIIRGENIESRFIKLDEKCGQAGFRSSKNVLLQNSAKRTVSGMSRNRK